jgi:hypothetical protein
MTSSRSPRDARISCFDLGYGMPMTRPSVSQALRVVIPTAVAAFVASRAVPWVVNKTRPVLEVGKDKAVRARAAVPTPGRSEPPLDGLTKEELYERAQAADIEGRSTMSKDELLRALKARS